MAEKMICIISAEPYIEAMFYIFKELPMIPVLSEDEWI